LPSTLFLQRSVYVDYDGGTFREAASVKRRFKSGSRLGGLHVGEQQNRLFGWYDGPATQFEISDNGQNIAVVYNASTSAWTNSGSGNANFSDSREDIEFMQATAGGADPWTTKTNTLITP